MRGHCRGLFVEGGGGEVALDTGSREAALEPEDRVKEPPAAESAAMEQMRLKRGEANARFTPHFL